MDKVLIPAVGATVVLEKGIVPAASEPILIPCFPRVGEGKVY